MVSSSIIWVRRLQLVLFSLSCARIVCSSFKPCADPGRTTRRHASRPTEEYAVLGGKPISVAEHDDGTAEIDGQFVDAHGAERRIRFLTRGNLLLAPQGSPVNGRHELDRDVERWLDQVLVDPTQVGAFFDMFLKLPRSDV